MALETRDLALALAELESRGEVTRELLLPGASLTLVRLTPGTRHEHVGAHPATLLVLEGMGTVSVDDWRATLAGGHVASVPAKAQLVVEADAGVVLCLLLTAPVSDGD
jgi:quercetin dioxygenase-like cupin family protein